MEASQERRRNKGRIRARHTAHKTSSPQGYILRCSAASRIRKGAKGTSHRLKTNFPEPPEPQFACCTLVLGQHKPLRKQRRSPGAPGGFQTCKYKHHSGNADGKQNPSCVPRAGPWGCRTSTPNPPPGSSNYPSGLVLRHSRGWGPMGMGRAACTSGSCQCPWLRWKL